jgi:cytochrome d ubiquinol oxidase subunit I
LILVGSSCEGVKEGESITALSVPGLFSILGSESYDVNAEMLGINNLNEKYTAEGFGNVQLQKETSGDLVKTVDKYNAANPDAAFDFAPSIPVSFWTFRIMIVLGGLAILAGIWVLIATNKGKSPKGGSLWTAAMIATPLMALFANSFGWIFAEMGRQPFVVYGVLPTMSANSPGVSALEVGLTMVLFTVIYGALAVVEVGLQLHFIKKGLPEVTEPVVLTDDDAPVSFAY